MRLQFDAVQTKTIHVYNTVFWVIYQEEILRK